MAVPPGCITTFGHLPAANPKHGATDGALEILGSLLVTVDERAAFEAVLTALTHERAGRR
jgi:hypothetical protein